MKISIIILCVLISATISAQEDWSLKRSTLKMKETAPVWPGCESDSPTKINACFNKMLVNHIQKNFKYPAEEYKKNIQGEVVVDFVINTKGLVEIKSATGGNKGLQESAKKIVSLIPKMKPGMFGGKPSVVPYIVPFNFKTGK
jgi:protein TonB